MPKLDEFGNPIVEPNDNGGGGDNPPAPTPAVDPVDPPAEKQFTQTQLNEIIKNRLDKQSKSFLAKLGVENDEEIDVILNKAKESDEAKTVVETLKSEVDTLTGEVVTLREQVAFNELNINPERYEDVRIYFKGKGLDLTPENLKTEIESHKEWVNKTNIEKVGADNPLPAKTNEREEAFKLFGV